MQRYFFHCADGTRIVDPHGLTLPDDQAAQLQAVRTAAEVLKNEPRLIWDKGTWRVEVTNIEKRLLFTVIILAVDAPQPEDLTNQRD